MGLNSEGLIIGRIFASELWGGEGGYFGKGLVLGGKEAYHRNFTVYPFSSLVLRAHVTLFQRNGNRGSFPRWPIFIFGALCRLQSIPGTVFVSWPMSEGLWLNFPSIKKRNFRAKTALKNKV